jgi:NAD(P)-dependent dehydrogenase (short-subunit alcohol dehydrogenase family)
MCQLPLFSSLAHLPALAAPPRWHSGVKAPESSSPADAMTSAKPSPRNCVSLGLKPTSRAATCFSRLDVVVNNAGTEGKPGQITEQSPESYAATFDANVLGTIVSLKHEMRVMLAQGSGSINLSSTFGSRGGAGASMYVASKHAVEGLTKAAALEGAAAGVRVNAVAPGPVKTELLNRFAGGAHKKAALAAGVPAQRLGTPEDIAAAIVFLASDKADFITGQIIGVNGGKTAL